MARQNILIYINKVNRSVFTTSEIVALSQKSSSVVTQSLNYLDRQGMVQKLHRGVWCKANGNISPYNIIPFLSLRNRVYVSFLSALHLHGIIEQIPQVITLATTGHSRIVKTKLGAFKLHQLSPNMFNGFNWYKGNGSFLIAESEKALVDSLYLSVYKKRQYGFFPEMTFSKKFSFPKAHKWARSISTLRVRKRVEDRLREIANG